MLNSQSTPRSFKDQVYGAFAGDAVRILRAHGRQAMRFEDGVADWAAAGLELAGEPS